MESNQLQRYPTRSTHAVHEKMELGFALKGASVRVQSIAIPLTEVEIGAMAYVTRKLLDKAGDSFIGNEMIKLVRHQL